MKDDLPENRVRRIDLGIDWSKCTKEETQYLLEACGLCEHEFNALCNNRRALIAGLENEPASAEDPIYSSKIKVDIQRLRLEIEDSKKKGLYQDYGALKRLVADGVSADELYPTMPSFYAETFDLVRRINARRDKPKMSAFAFLGGATLLGVVANLFTIRDSGVVKALREFLQL